MAWIKIKGNLINLNNVKKIDIDENALIFRFFEETKTILNFENEEQAKEVYEYLVFCIETGKNFINLDKILEKIVEQNKQNK